MSKTAQININIDTKNAQKNVKDISGTVGDFENRTHSLRTELRLMKEALLELDENTDQFKELALNAAQLEDALGDVTSRVRILSSDTLKLDQATGVITGMAGAYGVVQGSAALLGVENEELMKTMVKLQAIQNITNGLTQVANMLNKDSAAGILLRDLRTKLLNTSLFTQTAATGTATTATQALNLAMRALPLLAIIGAVTALIAVFSSMGKEVDNTAESVDKLAAKKLGGLEEEIKKIGKASEDLGDEFAELERQVISGEISQAQAIEKRRALIEDELNKLPNDTKQRLDASKRLIDAQELITKKEEETNANGQKMSREWLMRNEEYKNALADRKKALEGFGLTEHQINNLTLERAKQLSDAQKTLAEDEFSLRNSLIKSLNEIDKNTQAEQENRNKKWADNKKKRLEILFMIENQEMINELERLKRQEDELESEEDILAKKEEIINKEKEIANAKFDFLVKEAGKNVEKIKLLEVQRIGELEKLEFNYQNSVAQLSENSLKKQKEIDDKKITAKNDTIIALIELEKLQELATAKTEQEKLKIQKDFQVQLINARVQQVKDLRDIELSNTKLSEEQKQKIIAESELKIAQIRGEGIEDVEQSFEELMAKIAEITDLAFSAIGNIMNGISELSKVQAENDSIQREQQYEAETEELKSQLGNRLIDEEEYESKVEQLERAKAQEENVQRRKQFADDKKMKIGQAIMGLATGIIQSFAQLGPIAGGIMSAVVAATGALQISTIKQQQFRAARGGVVPGKASKKDSVDALLAPGEMVINSESSGMFPQTLSAINQMGGGIPLAPEGVMTASAAPIFADNKKQDLPIIKTYVLSSEVKEGLATDERNRDAATF